MKHFLMIPAFAAALLLTVTSCKKEDEHHSEDHHSSSTSSGSIVVSGNWKVTLYNDNGTDETYHYTDYSFLFSSGASVTASNSSASVTGTWSGMTDDSQLKLVLNFGSNIPFLELNNDWHVLEQTSTSIRLEDVSGGSGGTDYLTFEKI